MIGLIDCNNFFVSCERVFQPHLLGKPVIVLSSNDGCVISRSQEVKDIGVPMGIAVYKIREVIEQHKIHLCSTNFVLYRDMSRRVMNTIKSLVEECEVYSVDEAFFMIPEGEDAQEFCRKVRDKVFLNTGIPTSIGVASTKTLAKLANRHAKKSSGHVYVIVSDEQRISVLKETSVGEIWGIGRGFAERLSHSGILTAYSLAQAPDEHIRGIFGKNGLDAAYELRGIGADPLSCGHSPRKSIMSSRSFGTQISNKKELWNSIAYHVGELALDLRQEKQVAQVLSVGLYVNRFRGDRSFSKTDEHFFVQSTSDTKLLLRAAREIFERIFTLGGLYNKSGARVSHLMHEDRSVQETLFDMPPQEKERGLDPLLDEINLRHGTGKIMLGELLDPLRDNSWLPRAKMRSAQFTTSWKDLPIITKCTNQKS